MTTDKEAARMGGLLPAKSLAGMRVGVTAAGSPDLARLGLLDEHVGIVLGELTQTVLVGGGGLILGGRLSRDELGFVLCELARYGTRRDSLLVCLGWPQHRQMALSELERLRSELDPGGMLVCLDPDGSEIDPADARSNEPEVDPELCQRAMRCLRRYMRDRQSARVFIGGDPAGDRRYGHGYVEEALLALQAGQPIYLAGGFGGLTARMARALGIDDGRWLPPNQAHQGSPRPADECLPLAELTRSPRWTGLRNGLSDPENKQLAATHRPGEIAALVALGLGRHPTSGPACL